MPENLEFDLKPIIMTKSKEHVQQKKEIQKHISRKSHEQKKLEQLENDEYQEKKPSFELRKIIQHARQQKKMSQKKLAEALNIKQSVINDIEKGKLLPTPQQKSKIQQILGIKLPKY